MPRSPQQIIALAPNGRVYVETISANGSRVKIGVDGFDLRDFPSEIQANLLEQRDKIRAAEAKELHEAQKAHHDYVGRTLRAKNLADAVWPNIAFEYALKRKHNTDAVPKKRTKLEDDTPGEVMDI